MLTWRIHSARAEAEAMGDAACPLSQITLPEGLITLGVANAAGDPEAERKVARGLRNNPFLVADAASGKRPALDHGIPAPKAQKLAVGAEGAAQGHSETLSFQSPMPAKHESTIDGQHRLARSCRAAKICMGLSCSCGEYRELPTPQQLPSAPTHASRSDVRRSARAARACAKSKGSEVRHDDSKPDPSEATASASSFQPDPPPDVEVEPGPANVEVEPSAAHVEVEPSAANVEVELGPANVEAEPDAANMEVEPGPANVEMEPGAANVVEPGAAKSVSKDGRLSAETDVLACSCELVCLCAAANVPTDQHADLVAEVPSDPPVPRLPLPPAHTKINPPSRIPVRAPKQRAGLKDAPKLGEPNGAAAGCRSADVIVRVGKSSRARPLGRGGGVAQSHDPLEATQEVPKRNDQAPPPAPAAASRRRRQLNNPKAFKSNLDEELGLK